MVENLGMKPSVSEFIFPGLIEAGTEEGVGTCYFTTGFQRGRSQRGPPATVLGDVTFLFQGQYLTRRRASRRMLDKPRTLWDGSM